LGFKWTLEIDIIIYFRCIEEYFPFFRVPVSVDLDADDLKSEIDKALHMAKVNAERSSSFTFKVGHTKQKSNEVVDNVMACIQQVARKVPGDAVNLHSISFQTRRSPSCWLYLNFSKQPSILIYDVTHIFLCLIRFRCRSGYAPQEVSTKEGMG
jgi:hypothetical protein